MKRKIELLLLSMLCASCSESPVGDTAAETRLAFEVVGRLEDPAIREASGLAHSQRSDDTFWVINDSGADTILHAIDHTGRRLGDVEVRKADNRDWEDIASFTLDGEPYLLIADIGDNQQRHKTRTLYVLKEPKTDKKKTTVDWRIDFKYPDGPRDAEAVAVDVENQRVLILSKRDLPPALYEIPLRPGDDSKVTAKWLGLVTSLPSPSREDVTFAPKTKDWHWQPVAMDIADDNRAAVIQTYRALYYYLRRPGQDWFDALNSTPVRVSLGGLQNAEAAAFGRGNRAVFSTGEKRHSPLLSIDFDALARRVTGSQQVTVMSFNVQNLFDNHDDPGKDDKAYLPLAAKQNEQHISACNEIEVASWRAECLELDWDDAAVELKLRVLAATIRQVAAGRGADIIALQEVENVAILERLRTEHLHELGYGPAVLVEGDDARGIDVAFLARLPLAGEPVLHPLELEAFPERERDTRGVLQADFALPNGSVLTGFSVHFPAPFHPTAMRVAAYEHLARLRDALPASHHVFAAGDFNTTSTEDAREGMLQTYARPHWTIAHEVGCADCPGTYYYGRDDTWSFLDMILFSPARGEKTTAQIRADSVTLANRHPRQVSATGAPERFRLEQDIGVSDHWPLVATIEVTQKQ